MKLRNCIRKDPASDHLRVHKMHWPKAKFIAAGHTSGSQTKVIASHVMQVAHEVHKLLCNKRHAFCTTKVVSCIVQAGNNTFHTFNAPTNRFLLKLFSFRATNNNLTCC